MTLLGIDGGGSGTKWALVGPDGEVLRQGRVGPLTGHVFVPADRNRTKSVLQALAAEVLARGQPAPDAVVAGISGLQQGADAAFRSLMSEVFVVEEARVWVTDDLQLVYAAQFTPGEGVLVYAGTGSVTYHRTAGGEVVRAGGHGFLLGDEGGAFWQGRAALKALLKLQDEGKELAGPLADELAGLTGGLAWPQLRRYVYEGGRSALAALAPGVYRAALAADPLAVRVLADAGRQLARLAGTVLARLESIDPSSTSRADSTVKGAGAACLPLVLAGGAANPLVRAAFVAELPDFVHLLPRPPVLGAPRLHAQLRVSLETQPS